MIGLLLLSTLGAFGWTASRRLQRRAQDRRRRDAMADALVDVADLLAVVLGAGASIPFAIRWLAERGPTPTRHGFAEVLTRIDSGQPVVAALRSIPNELGADYRPLTDSLVVASRDGAPTGLLLLRLGDEARAARRRQQDRQARALPVHMLFPLVLCSLPAVIVGAVVPLLVVAIGRL